MKKPIAKKPTGLKQASNTNENQEACQQKQTTAENRELHEKLACKEKQIDQLMDQIQQLSSELAREKEINTKLQSSLDQFKESVDSKKLVAIGMSIINNLAIPTDMSELNVFKETKDSEATEMVCSIIFMLKNNELNYQA